MCGPTFPTDIFIGLVFNDFIDKVPFMVNTYVPYALRFQKATKSYILIMDEDMHEIIQIDNQSPVPRWLLYSIDREIPIAKLDRFICSKLTCLIKDPLFNLFSHPSDVCVYTWKEDNGIRGYLLTRTMLV